MRQIFFDPMPLIKCRLQYTVLIVHAILKLTWKLHWSHRYFIAYNEMICRFRQKDKGICAKLSLKFLWIILKVFSNTG